VSLSLYDVSIPVYQRMLGNLAWFLDKAEAHAKAGGPSLEALADAKLIDDMASFTRQIQLASDAAKSGAARLAQQEPPSMPDTETSFAELKDRIAKTQAFLASVKREAIDGGETRTIELKLPNRTMTFSGLEFLTGFSLPNFLFHVTTAYAILRAKGVPLGKMDFLGGAQAAQAA
jgi:hypothetical protein